MWINAREVAPSGKEWTPYLVTLDSGAMMVVRYCDGWNCYRDPVTGEINRNNEFTDVAAWRELPLPPSWMHLEV